MTTLKPIPGSPGYSAGDDGEIYSHLSQRMIPRGGCVIERSGTPKKLNASVRNRGYKVVKLQGGSPLYVHRLVCAAFHGTCPKGHECAHLDGDPSNNTPDNLAWVTHRGKRSSHEATWKNHRWRKEQARQAGRISSDSHTRSSRWRVRNDRADWEPVWSLGGDSIKHCPQKNMDACLK